MSSQTSDSEAARPGRSATSTAFELLDSPLQRWVYDEGWQSLRAVQEKAIPLLIDAAHDVILSATTAWARPKLRFCQFSPTLSRTRLRSMVPGCFAFHLEGPHRRSVLSARGPVPARRRGGPPLAR